jgi:ketosteroid isomerase-like protein
MTTQTTQTLDTELNQMILSGQALDAFDKYYADDVVMQEGGEEPRRGKAANRAYEEQFFGAIAEFHGAQLLASAATGDHSYSEWVFDMTFKDGTRVTNTQVAAREWKDGQIVKERFYVIPG